MEQQQADFSCAAFFALIAGIGYFFADPMTLTHMAILLPIYVVTTTMLLILAFTKARLIPNLLSATLILYSFLVMVNIDMIVEGAVDVGSLSRLKISYVMFFGYLLWHYTKPEKISNLFLCFILTGAFFIRYFVLIDRGAELSLFSALPLITYIWLNAMVVKYLNPNFMSEASLRIISVTAILIGLNALGDNSGMFLLIAIAIVLSMVYLIQLLTDDVQEPQEPQEATSS